MRLQLVQERFGQVSCITRHPSPRPTTFRPRRRPVCSQGVGGPVPIFCEPRPRRRPERLITAFGMRQGVPSGAVPHRVRADVRPPASGSRSWVIRSSYPAFFSGTHGRPCPGFLIATTSAYCTYVSRIPDESWPLLEGLDKTLILDALGPEPHPHALQPRTPWRRSNRLAEEWPISHPHHPPPFDHEATEAPWPPRWLWPTMASLFDFLHHLVAPGSQPRASDPSLSPTSLAWARATPPVWNYPRTRREPRLTPEIRRAIDLAPVDELFHQL